MSGYGLQSVVLILTLIEPLVWFQLFIDDGRDPWMIFNYLYVVANSSVCDYKNRSRYTYCRISNHTYHKLFL